MRRILPALCATALFLFSAACTSEFDGSRIGNDSEFIVEYKILNKTDSQSLKIQSGDTIIAEIIVNGGTLAIKIQKDGEPPIYEQSVISSSGKFDLTVDESGIYTVTVSGTNAKGSVSFTVDSNEHIKMPAA